MNNRRNFLKIAGVGLTGSVLNTVNSSAADITLETSAVKIGVLLPQSNENPFYSGSFINGLRLATYHNGLSGNKIELITLQISDE